MTALLPAWAELVYHDLVKIGSATGADGHCCSAGAGPHCLPIVTSRGQCQEYGRSAPAPRQDCRLGPREQMNMASSFLDGSFLYGTDSAAAKRIRSLSRGQLKTGPGGGLPRGNSAPCRTSTDGCPEGADARAGTHAGTVALYTLLTREHNRLAAHLSELNPQWGDERTFQAARTVLVAQLQHVTYSEFLPVVLGQGVIQDYQLGLLSSGFYQDYTMDEDPAVSSGAAAAALRFYLALLPGYFQYKNTNGTSTGEAPLSASFFSSFDLYKEGRLDQLLLGLTSGPASQGGSITEQVTQALGVDLAAETIQRGRDHGLPGYTQYRTLCGLPEVHEFQQLRSSMKPQRIDLLQRLYRTPSDVDLFVGGVLESPLEGAAVGPTFACLLGRQFRAVRRTDRFWYETDMPPASLTKEQLYQIRKSSIARLLCNNVESMKELPPNVFMKQDIFLNAPVLCDMLPNPDIFAWKSASSGVVMPETVFRDVIRRARSDLERRRGEERRLFELDLTASHQSALGTALAQSRPNKQAIVVSNTSMLLEYASMEFMDAVLKPGRSRMKRQLVNLSNQISNGPRTRQGFSSTLRQFDVSNLVSQVPIVDQCRAEEETGPCNPSSQYRTYSGYCNNLNNPNYGKSVMPQQRLLPAKYDDGISRPRQRSVTGQNLPSPRFISTNLHSDVSSPHTRYTMFLMQFGQFLDHDVSLTPIHRGFGDSILNCRDCDSANRVHPECLPIPVPQNDPYFPPVNISSGRPFCLAFTRSLPGQQSLGAREQLTQNTAFIDASQIYGQQQCEARTLRSFQGGRLVVTPSRRGGKGLLPTTRDNKECRAPSGSCFAAGDNRASEQPGLATLHTMWVREHNRVVKNLAGVNPHWDDEKLYQEGRRIVTAEWEHITYNEFLPRVLGWNAMQLYDLRVGNEGFFKGYDSSCSAAVLNEFSTAAFRFGHSLIRPSLKRMDIRYGEKNPSVPLRGNFFNSDVMFDDQMVDDIMRGLISTTMENLDNHITDEVTKHLFEERGIPFSGLDLVSLNIQRGRDHGLQPYNEYRAICNLKKASTFDDLSREIPRPLIEKMKQVYASVDDIDLFTGGLSETQLQGGLVGPTFGCIIGLQFRFLKKCDRFWYETEDAALRFTEQQLADIRKVTISRVMCQNCDQIDSVQRALFDMPQDFLNPRIPCRTMADINFQLWKEGSNGGGQCNVNGVSISAGTTASISPCTRCTCNNGQTSCQSVRVASCQQLASQSGRDAVLADTSCRVQCLAELGGGQGSSFSSTTTTTFSSSSSSSGQRPPKTLLPPSTTTFTSSGSFQSDAQGFRPVQSNFRPQFRRPDQNRGQLSGPIRTLGQIAGQLGRFGAEQIDGFGRLFG